MGVLTKFKNCVVDLSEVVFVGPSQILFLNGTTAGDGVRSDYKPFADVVEWFADKDKAAVTPASSE